jgi:hypothetical protein
MVCETLKKRFRPGDNEGVWWEEAKVAAASWGCLLTSFRGDLWPSSKGREFLYGVEGSEDNVQGYVLARPG